MSMTYTDLQNALTILAVQAPSPYLTLPVDFSTYLPRVIEYAENRIYRALGTIGTRRQDTTLAATSGSREINLSSAAAPIIVPEGFAILYPVGSTTATGEMLAFDGASLDLVDMLWPTQGETLDPSTTPERYWAMKDNATLIMMPTPDADYNVVITGLIQPAPISASNQTTYLSTTYPELLLAGCMISVAGYLRDYGQQSDDPKFAASWETQYEVLEKSAIEKEDRIRGKGVDATAFLPSPLLRPAAPQ